MSTRAVTPAAPAAAYETPNSMEEALETGFLPDDPHYRLTGEFAEDEKAEKKAASAASTTKSAHDQDTSEKEAASAAATSETAAASEAATTQEKKGQQKTSASSESRWAKITRENRELREKLARAEATSAQPTTRETQQASQPAAEAAATSARPKIDDVDPKTGKPKYATYADYEAAKDEWLSGETIRKFQETSAKSQKEQQLAQAERVLAEGFAKKLETSRTTHADFDTVALNPDLVIPRGSVTDGFLLDSDHAGEVLYYLGQHPEILTGFYGQHDPKTGKFVNKVTPYAQARELTKIELKIAGGTASGTSSQETTSSARQVTQAPRPPNQVSGKGTVAKEAVEQAVEDNDFETYAREQNARELARRRRK